MNKPFHVHKSKCTNIPKGCTLEEYALILNQRFESSKKALAIANKLKSKEHKANILSCMNELRSLIYKIKKLKKEA